MSSSYGRWCGGTRRSHSLFTALSLTQEFIIQPHIDQAAEKVLNHPTLLIYQR